jgi:O-glycosyl hydrolase
MTEYEHRKGKFFKTSWLINNVMTQANTSAYFYWDLIWPKSGLIDIDNPFNKSDWLSEKGYRLTPHYYAFKHFSRFIQAGYTRIDIRHTNEALKSSAYLSKDGSSITIVLINPYKNPVTSAINLNSKFEIKGSQVYQSVEDKYFTSLGQLKANNSLVLPAESVTTVVLQIANKK